MWLANDSSRTNVVLTIVNFDKFHKQAYESFFGDENAAKTIGPANHRG
jgi:hypothetical protein